MPFFFPFRERDGEGERETNIIPKPETKPQQGIRLVSSPAPRPPLP